MYMHAHETKEIRMYNTILMYRTLQQEAIALSKSCICVDREEGGEAVQVVLVLRHG